MFCVKCGLPVSGKYCSNCGKKVVSTLEEFRRIERQLFREFRCGKNKSVCEIQIAHAAWYAANENVLSKETDIFSPPCVILLSVERLYEASKKAESLYAKFMKIVEDV